MRECENPLQGAVLKISNPPVCNSILITGLTKSTTKGAIEMYFEHEKNGGGRIYGDVIYQKDNGKAVVSFCDPQGKVKYRVYKKKFTVGKYSLNEQAHKIFENFPLAWEVQHSLVHLAIKSFKNLSFSM